MSASGGVGVKIKGFKRWALIATALACVLSMMPAHAQRVLPLFDHQATGTGTDGVGNRLTILAVDDFLVGGLGVAFVRLANQNGAAAIVVLDCVTFDLRPGNGFHFLYASGTGTDGRTFYIGVFDDSGPSRTGPYDVMYTQTTPVNGPCGVAAVSSYPIGWFPVSSGSFTVN